MNLKEYKVKFLESWVQFIVFDGNGDFVDSCNTLFTISDQKANLFTSIPFLESVKELFGTLKKDERINFPCISTEMDDYEGFCDYIFYQFTYHGKACILWIVADFTEHYTNLTTLQQQRNESVIQKELLEVEKKNALIARNFLEYKNEELLRLQKVKSDFFSSISHEIRTPVNGILGLSELLSDSSKPPNPDYIKAIYANSKHLSSVVNDVLDIAKIEANKITFESIDFDLRKLIKTVLDSFVYLGKERGIKIKSKVSSDVPEWVRGDSVKLSQVLYNLLNNALKFTKRGSVELALEVLEKSNDSVELMFIVTDTGIGISEKNVTKIFNPYEQAERDTYRLYGGTGLGLNIVKQLLELQGGNISVESELAKGTKFTVVLPLRIVKENEEVLNPLSFVQKPLSVLIGEDDLITQRVLNEFMTRWGYQVDIVDNGKAVVNSLTSGKYDLLILDNKLPKLTGYEVIECINHDFPHISNKIPIIILTGDTSDEITKQFIEAGVSKVLTKPVEASTLLLSINEAIVDSENETPLIDLEYVKGVSNYDNDLVFDMVNIFIESIPLQLRKLIQVLRASNYTEAKDIIHKIAPSYKYMGIKRASSILEYLGDNMENTEKKSKVVEQLNLLDEITELSIVLLKKEKVSLQS